MAQSKSRTQRGGALAVALTLSAILFNHPDNTWICVICSLIACALIYAFSDYPSRAIDGFQCFVRWGLLLVLCATLSFAWGWEWWQAITISPGRVSFEGYPNETFNFSIRNGTSDDIYDVQVPFLIGYGKHFDDRFSAKVRDDGEIPQRLYDPYNYCYGKKGEISKVLPNEQEVLIVRIAHLSPFGIRSFSITYAGGEKIDTQPGRPDFVKEPYSYSPNQFTVGVRGDYRICSYVIKSDGLVGK